MRLIIGFLLVVVVSAAAWANDTKWEELKRIQSADPAADLQVAIEKGGFRFRAVRGLVVYAPGIDPYYQSKYGYRIIEGTSDVVTREVEIAIRYAERYNELLLEKIKKREAREVRR